MAEPPTSIDQTPEWQALVRHHEAVKDTHLRELFATDPGRCESLTCELFGRAERIRTSDLRSPRPLHADSVTCRNFGL